MLKSNKTLIFLCIAFLLVIGSALIFSFKSTWGMNKYYIDVDELNATQVNYITDTFNVNMSDSEQVKRLCVFSYKNGIKEYILEINTNKDLESFLTSNPYIQNNFFISEYMQCYYNNSTVFIKVVETESIDKDVYVLKIKKLYQEIFESTFD